MAFEQQCPRCGDTFTALEAGTLADDVVAHARDVHGHSLDRRIVLAHLVGTRPDEHEGGAQSP